MLALSHHLLYLCCNIALYFSVFTIRNIDNINLDLRMYIPTDFNKIGGLPTLYKLLSNPLADLRWRAAELVATSS